MKSLHHLGEFSATLPISADDILEFHAARLLLLFHTCGVRGGIDSLTKMAKLDFFVRYPDFFDVARRATLGVDEPISVSDAAVESAMVRHHYGPWDKRYYHVLAYLEAKRLIHVSKDGSAYRLALTEAGRVRARELAALPGFRGLVDRMKEVKAAFGRKTGNALKTMIYDLFDEEVGRRPLGEVIRK